MARILMIANNSWNLQHFRRPVMIGLADAGHAITTVSPDPEGIEVEGIRPPHRPWTMQRAGMNPLKEAATLERLRRIIAQEEPDLVFSFTIKPNLYAALAGRLTGTPVIPNVSGLGSSFLGRASVRATVKLLYKTAFASSPRVFFQNDDDERLFVQSRIVREKQARVVPGSGIDLANFTPAELPSSPRFLMVGRLLRDKGVREYVRAAEMLRDQLPDARFALLGDLDLDNPTAITEQELQTWAARGVLDYLGSVADVRPFISEASAIVLPSYREGLPRALLEGAAMARPLIATDVPGCRQLVREGMTGYLCEARDTVSLAAAMERLASAGHEERLAMGLQARRMVETEFDQQLVVDAYLAAATDFCR